MKPQDIRDLGTTIAGGGAGLLLLNSIEWAKVAGGETTKLAVAVLLILFGYAMYAHCRKQPPEPPADPGVNPPQA